jgi:hypothetical protein
MIQEKDHDPDEPPIPDVAWDIRREGRRWDGDEAMAGFARECRRRSGSAPG